MNTILEHFEQHFETCISQNDDVVTKAQRLRYQVYCNEHNFLEKSNYHNDTELDEFDGRSVHTLLVHKNSQLPVATVRLILSDSYNPESPFPLESFDILRRYDRDKQWRIPRHALGEISRFGVSKKFRRRLNEIEKAHGITNRLHYEDGQSEKRQYAEITLGLFRAVTQMSFQTGVTHWYAAMEPSLIVLLAKVGIRFRPVGPLVDYHGLRQPCIGVAEEIIEGLFAHDPVIWAFVTDNGRLIPRAEQQSASRFELN